MPPTFSGAVCQEIRAREQPREGRAVHRADHVANAGARRVVAKVEQVLLHRNVAECEHDEWDAAVRGSLALRAGLLSVTREEVAALNGEDVATILFDMGKFYDHISIAKLVQKFFPWE